MPQLDLFIGIQQFFYTSVFLFVFFFFVRIQLVTKTKQNDNSLLLSMYRVRDLILREKI